MAWPWAKKTFWKSGVLQVIFEFAPCLNLLLLPGLGDDREMRVLRQVVAQRLGDENLPGSVRTGAPARGSRA